MAKFQKGNPGGPGRPRKADSHAGAIARAEKKIADKLPELVDNMLLLAGGVWLQEATKDGQRIYLTAPDYRALQYLMDRVMGKVKEQVEASGDILIRVRYESD